MQAEFNAINDLYESMHNTEIRILIEENGLKRMNPFQAYTPGFKEGKVSANPHLKT